jgi:hypothetical protein
MLDLAEAKLDVRGAALGGIRPGLADHLGRHVHADDAAALPDLPCREEAVDAAAAAEVQHRLAGLQGGDRQRVAAAERHLRALGKLVKLRLRVAQGRRRTAAAAAGGGAFRDPAVGLAYRLADLLVAQVLHRQGPPFIGSELSVHPDRRRSCQEDADFLAATGSFRSRAP